MNEEPFILAMREAKRELDHIKVRLQELAELSLRANALQQFLEVSATLIGPLPGLDSIQQVLRDNRIESKALSAISGDQLWKGIQLIMEVRRRPMTSQEVLEALEHENFRIQGDHKRETVRSAISRKPELFERIGRGLFVMKDWPDELKHSRDNHGSDSEAVEETAYNQ